MQCSHADKLLITELTIQHTEIHTGVASILPCPQIHQEKVAFTIFVCPFNAQKIWLSQLFLSNIYFISDFLLRFLLTQITQLLQYSKSKKFIFDFRILSNLSTVFDTSKIFSEILENAFFRRNI